MYYCSQDNPSLRINYSVNSYYSLQHNTIDSKAEKAMLFDNTLPLNESIYSRDFTRPSSFGIDDPFKEIVILGGSS